MNAESKSARSIFLDAVDVAPGEERMRSIDSACAGDETLRRDVLRLLNAYGDLNSFMEHPAAHAAGADPTVDRQPAERVGATIGPYKLLEQIGEGGMGLVFMAEQTRPLRRRVALKIIKPGLDTRAVIARFEAERQALALMDHTNIARVYDAGATESGRPFFVMELVRGAPITAYCQQRNVQLRERLNLFTEVCDAVQHAHQKGVIHRDLKPTNILVAQNDTKPVPKVIDFGVAKATIQPLTEQTLFTAFSQIIGTPLYMSPEQADLGNQDIDTRSDVFSLGVVLYELLTGATPFDAERLRSAGADEMRRIIREEEPPKPSTRATTAAVALSTVAAKPQPSPQVDISALKGDLDWIVMKALEKDRNRRYESASAFASDIERYLNDEPVEAGPPSAFYRFRKFARRNRGPLIAATLGIGLLVLATAGLAVSSFLIANERDAAVTARNEASDNFQLARSAVDKLMTRVAEEELLNAPKMEPLRHSLLTDALEFYQQMLKRDSKNPQLQHEVALAQRRVGDILTELGREIEALNAHEDAIRRLRALVAGNPEAPEFKLSLADVLRSVNPELRATAGASGQKSNAQKRNCDEAVSLLEDLVRAEPTNPDYQFALAQAHFAAAWATPEDDTKRKKMVIPLRKARELIEPLASGPNATLAQKVLFARVLNALGHALAPAHEGRQAFEDAILIHRELIQGNQSDQNSRKNLAGALWNYLQHFPPVHQDEDLALRKEFVKVMEGLAADFPSVPFYRVSVAMGCRGWRLLYHAVRKTPGLCGPGCGSGTLSPRKGYLEELIREQPGDKYFYDLLNLPHKESVIVHWKYTSTDQWLHAEDEYRRFLLKRAEDLSDNDKLLDAAFIELQTSTRLMQRGLNEEASRWAHDVYEHLRTWLVRRPQDAQSAGNTSLYWASTAPVDIQNRGLKDEAAELDQQILPLLKEPEDFGAYHAARGNFAEAARHYQAAARKEPTKNISAVRAALLLAMVDDRAAYENVCQQLLEQFGDTTDPFLGRLTSRACCVSSRPVGSPDRLVQLADLEVKEDLTKVQDLVESLNRFLIYYGRGLAAYRAGDWDGALNWCRKSRQDTDRLEGQALNLLVEAMALHRLNKPREAKGAFDKGLELKRQAFPTAAAQNAGPGCDWETWIELELLHREAETLLDVKSRDVESAVQPAQLSE